MITGEILIKGLFYFMLKSKEGGKYRSRKKMVGPKTGKMRWGGYVYDTPKKSVKQPKPKADNESMKDVHIKENISSLFKELPEINTNSLSSSSADNKKKSINSIRKKYKKEIDSIELPSDKRRKMQEFSNVDKALNSNTDDSYWQRNKNLHSISTTQLSLQVT